MRGRGHGAPLGPPGLDDHDRLFSGGLLHRIDKARPVLDAFDIHEDDLGALLPGEILKQISLINIALVADGNDGRKPDIFHFCFADHGKARERPTA